MNAKTQRTRRARGPRPSEARWCREPGCPVQVILARIAPRGAWAPFEALDREPFSEDAVGARVLISNEAWRPVDAIEDFRVRFEIGEDQARELVAGYPFHRIHTHQTDHQTQPVKETHPS